MGTTSLLLISGLLSPIRASSPGVSIEKTWGGNSDDVANAIVQDASGLYVAGSTTSYGAGQSDILVLKYDSSGNLVWRTTWGTINYEFGTDIDRDSSGNLYVSGYTRGAGCDVGDCVDAVLLKLDSGGNPVWVRTWGNGAASDGEYAYGILVNSDSIFLTGETAGGTGNGDIFVLKFNSTGSLLDQQIYVESTTEERGRAMTMDDANNLFVASTAYSSLLGRCWVLILKFNSTFAPIARWEVEGSKCDEAYAITRDLTTTTSDNLYVTGRTTSFGAGGQDVFLLKLRPTGQSEWVTSVGGAGNETGYGVCYEPIFNNFYVVGATNSYPLTSQHWGALLLKFNSTGDLQSSKLWGGVAPVDEAHACNSVYTAADTIPIVGFVSESPPYAISGGPSTVGTSGWGVGITTFSTINPKYDPLVPSGTTQHPLGVESYGGQKDVFLLQYSFAPLLTPSIPGFLGILAVTATAIIIRLSKRTFAKR